MPTSVASTRRAPEGGAASGVGKCEREQVEQLLDERADRRQVTALLQGADQLAAYLCRALQCGAAPIAERLDAERLLLRRCGRARRRRAIRAEQAVERSPPGRPLAQETPQGAIAGLETTVGSEALDRDRLGLPREGSS